MTLHRAGTFDATASACFLPLCLTSAPEDADAPEREFERELGLATDLPVHLANTGGASTKYQALGRGLQTLGSWSARVGQEGLLRPVPAPHLPGSRVGGRGQTLPGADHVALGW